MPKIQNFDELSKTTQWLVRSTIDHLDVWPEDGRPPDLVISVGGIEIDPSEFFCAIADLTDEDVERRSEEGVLARFDNLLGAFVDDVEDVHSEFRKHVSAVLRDSKENQ